MLCRKPFMAGLVPFGCGQCLHCRINRRRQWMWRQVLESYTHDASAFVTLTYDGPNIRGDWSLDRRALQLFIKRLRKAVEPHKFRFFAVGEYGEESNRPHYHLSLFGLSGSYEFRGEPVAKYEFNAKFGRFETVSGIIHRVWGRGRVDVGEFSDGSAQYIAGYVTKKLTDYKYRRVWNVPEFAVMSNRPGIGAPAMSVLARSLCDEAWGWGDGDVPHELRTGRRAIPLGRYLLGRLRKESGFEEVYCKEIKERISHGRSVELLDLYVSQAFDKTFREKYVESIEGKLAQQEARSKLRATLTYL